MARRQKSGKRSKPKTVLRLLDLEQSKTAVLKFPAAASSQESYGHAIDEFIGWYWSEPRLAFNRTVVLRYRFFLELWRSITKPICTSPKSTPAFGKFRRMAPSRPRQEAGKIGT